MSIFTTREAHPNDAPGMAKVHVDTWRAAYRGILPDDFLDSLSYQATAEGWQKAFTELRSPEEAVFVAENEEKEIVGITSCGPEHSQDPIYKGEIYLLYVLPKYQHQGIGRGLVAACVRHLVHQLGVETMLIWVMSENPYRRFYEALGGRPVREKTVEVGGNLITDVGYGWEELRGLLTPTGW